MKRLLKEGVHLLKRLSEEPILLRQFVVFVSVGRNLRPALHFAFPALCFEFFEVGGVFASFSLEH